MRRVLVVGLVLAGLLACAPQASAGGVQGESAPPAVAPNGRPGGGRLAPAAGMTARQVEQLFDRYMLGQARIALQLGPDQLLTFGPRLERLQTIRRATESQRQRLLNDLGTLARASDDASEGETSRKLAELDELSRTSQQQLQDAYKAIDEVLRPRQRARFRIFERRMEQQKLELIARARQQARGAAR